MGLQKRIQLLGVSRQSAKGTIAASVQYGMGTLGGGVLVADAEDKPDEITSLDAINSGAIREGAKAGGVGQFRAYLASIGFWLYMALGNLSTSGAGPDYTHTITPATVLQYVSLFGRLDAEYSQVRDCMVDELTIEWAKAGPVKVTVTLMGTVLTYAISPWTATNDEALSEKFYGAGGTFKLDGDSGTAVDAPIAGGKITIKNNVKHVELSKAITPDDVFPGVREITCELDLVPETNLALWREASLGSPTGTTFANTPVYGSFDVLFSLASNKQLQIASTRVPWKIAYPEGDPAGGPVELKAVGSVLKPSGAAITATVKNQTASYPAV